VQEVAFTLSNAKAYAIEAINKGLDINVFGQRLSFFFNAHNNFFEEIAKFRAARRMWARMSKELGATNPKAQMLRFHIQTGGSTLQAQQADNNIVRVTLQALAAVLGGTQSLHTNGFDEALSLPTENAARIALRTQQIIAHESGVTDTVDPLGGSYFIEELTNRIEEEANAYIAKIDGMGGAVNAIEQGYMQKEIADASYRYQTMVEKNEKIIVGVNRFEQAEKITPPIFKIDDTIRKVQIAKLDQLKNERDSNMVLKTLAAINRAAKDGTNLMPLIIDAAEHHATLGEIADELRLVFGEYKG
jgi:methylmalonyl-CoA mutase N-terminal domain/subunit